MSIEDNPLKTIFRAALTAVTLIAGAPLARAHEAEAKGAAEAPAALEGEEDSAEEFDTKHIFGFTEGTDVGEVGEKEAEFESTGSVGKFGGGRYNAVEQLATFEAAATSRFGYEVSLHGVSQTMSNVAGLNNLGQTNFSGVSVAPKWIFLTRGVDAPFGLAVSMEPEFDRIDPVIGAHSSNFVLGTRVHLDTELIPKKLYFGANLVYSPEVDNEQGFGISQYTLAGATAALTYRVTPKFSAGGEVEYYESYSSLGFSNRIGSGTYIGPTVSAKIAPHAFLAAGWSVLVGKDIPAGATALALYNQSDFSSQRGKLVLGFEF